MKLLDTIAAVSTPYGKGGVAMIRISGEDALAVGDRIFQPANGKALSEQICGKMTYGEIREPKGESVDDGMALYFRAPHSFTGEDTVEITCHGGILVTEKVLRCALLAGARAAEAGEFTRRAYVGGKLRLAQAEALGNLLEAKSDAQLSLARSGLKGSLADRIDEIYLDLRQTMTSVYAAIDFPEEDLSEMSREEIAEHVERALDSVRSLASTYGTGRAISEGIPTVIAGRTNAGKSSVYNRILGYDAAIVTDIEGTTRDILRETAVLGKTMLRLSDTAGIRATDDPVEGIGIDRAREEMKRAGLILAVFDSARELDGEDLSLAREIADTGIPAIALLNKCDRPTVADLSMPERYFTHTLAVSAADGTGFSELGKLIDALFIDGSIDVRQDAVVTGARQYASLLAAAESLSAALSDLSLGTPLDLCCIGMENALTSLGELDGRELGEEIVAEIFSRFCVGK